MPRNAGVPPARRADRMSALHTVQLRGGRYTPGDGKTNNDRATDICERLPEHGSSVFIRVIRVIRGLFTVYFELHTAGSYFAVAGAGAGLVILQLAGLSISATFKP